MRPFFALTFALSILGSCVGQNEQKASADNYKSFVHADYELHKPKTVSSATLVLFGGYPESAVDIKREFPILEKVKQYGISVVYTNYSRKLWLEQDELNELASQLESLFATHALPGEKVYFGGFSSGGNVALLIANHLVGKDTSPTPAGVFIVDSPIDLMALYRTAEINVRQNFSEGSVQEGKFIIQALGDRFGAPESELETYERYSVFTSKTGNIENLRSLEKVKIRLYTEPDTLWWKTNRMVDYEQTNAYYIAQLFKVLDRQGFDKVEYIATQNRGYRANGSRHPHSWSIVEPGDLIDWMLKD